MNRDENLEDSSRTISRRTVVKGVAWAAPVVALSNALPAYAASPPPPGTAGLSSAWYSCNNGTFEFYFNPAPSITDISQVTIQSDWAPFNSPFTLTRSTVNKDRQNNTARYLFKFQNPGGTSSQDHFTTLRWCALDQLRFDNSILTVTYVEGGVTKTTQHSGYDIAYSSFTMGNAQSCGVCGTDGSTVNPGATSFGKDSITYDGKTGKWSFKFTAASGAAAEITNIEMYIPSGSCSSASPIATWSGSAASSVTLAPEVTTNLGPCGSGQTVWINHYGSNTGQNTKCPSQELYSDGTYFKITHANGYVETLHVPPNGTNPPYKISNTRGPGACSS